MVRAVKVGKPRSFWIGLLLTVVTFGIYSYFWRYKVHNEIYKQFDLEDEGRNEGVVWLILGIIFGVLLLVYDWIFVSNVNLLQQRLGLRQRIKPVGWLLFELLIFALLITAIIFLVIGAGENAKDLTGPKDAGTGLIATGNVILLVALLIAPIPYYMLQSGVNEIWTAYDARMGQLPPAAGAPAWPGAPSTQPGGAPPTWRS